MLRFIFLFIFCTAHVAFAIGGADSAKKDTAQVVMKQYLGASSVMFSHQRLVGLPEQYNFQFGNAPIIGIGITAFWWGDLLFQTNKLRWGGALAKFVNTYPSPKLFENLRTEFQFGYLVAETPVLKAYLYLGYGGSIFSLDSISRIFLLSVEGGMGVDYFLPNTPLVFTLQAGYNHSFNLRAASDAPGNQPGLVLRANISFFLRDKYTYWGFE